MKRFNKKSGFTLVEMVIYIAFFSILSSLAVGATVLVMKAFYSLRLTQSVNESATVAMERMSREVRNAYDFDVAQSTFGVNPGRLMLKTKDAVGANTTIEFYVDGSSQLGLKEGGVDRGSLLTKNAVFTTLLFRSITMINSKAIKIEATIRDSRSTTVQVANFYDTIVLRGSSH